MPAIQSLKKQLRGIRSTQKLAKAMKTISAVKFSKLNGIYNSYSEYSIQCKKIFEQYSRELLDSLREADPSAPPAVIVFSSNKGLCGNFNSAILNFAREELARLDSAFLIACGKKAIGYFNGKKLRPDREYVLDDIPSYEQSNSLLNDIIELRSSGRVSDVYIIYPEYTNMMRQTPTVCRLFSPAESESSETVLFVPDRSTIATKTAKTILRAMFYKIILESAIGAQAATLLTMRSAYDTATEHCAQLEGHINRLRQNAVTADVIETSAE